MFHALEVFTTVVVGVMVGVEFAVATVMNTIFNALPDDANQAANSHGGRILGAVMPVWYIGSVVLAAIWAFAGRDHGGTGLVITAAGLLLVSVVMSIALLVPINNRNKTWTAESRPADWKEQLNQWTRYHYVRVAIIVAAFAVLVAAIR
jgi:uncharacterized membrane protein